MMAETNTCPKCGAEIPADAPGGICPKCLMAAGLLSDSKSRSHPPDGEPPTHTQKSSDFVPPKPESLAAKFPQLEILELVGKGGMGAVYKARQRELDRLVAVKILPPAVGQDPAFAERFTREARALAKLNHQNIVQVYDFGRNDEFFYFIMEFVDGVNLRHTIHSGSLAPDEALAIVPQICEALHFAHDEGIVHRDIKPENILIDKRGRVKIADFGLAKLLGEAPAEFTLTGTDQVMGTLHYMAPEQTQGSRTVDHRADIYSLGVVFYEILETEGDLGSAEVMLKVLLTGGPFLVVDEFLADVANRGDYGSRYSGYLVGLDDFYIVLGGLMPVLNESEKRIFAWQTHRRGRHIDRKAQSELALLMARRNLLDMTGAGS